LETEFSASRLLCARLARSGQTGRPSRNGPPPSEANDGSSLLSLISLASQWRWETETVDLLWALTKRPEKQTEAMATLYRHYSKAVTRKVCIGILRLSEADPKSRRAE
jgi:hypothetical protein